MDAITISGLKKQFPKSKFKLELPRLTVREGYITGFIGENGAGKTTTLKLLVDLLFPDEGTLTILGKDAHLDGETIRRQIGYIGEQPGFLGEGKLKALKAMIAPFYESWDEAAFRKYAEHFSLDLEKKYKTLSKGKQKQFALAMALSHHPKLLLLDEPTANLDPLVRQEMLDLLTEEIQRQDVTVFFSTHITSDLDKIADYLLFLHDGRLLLEGEKDALLDSRRMVKGRRELLTPETAGLFVDVGCAEFGFTGLTERAKEVYELLGDEAMYEKPTVEEIFIAYTKGERGAAK